MGLEKWLAGAQAFLANTYIVECCNFIMGWNVAYLIVGGGWQRYGVSSEFFCFCINQRCLLVAEFESECDGQVMGEHQRIPQGVRAWNVGVGG